MNILRTQPSGLKQHSHHGENLLAIMDSVLPATALDIDYFLRGFREHTIEQIIRGELAVSIC